MSKSAAGFFVLALLSGILHLSLVEDAVITLPLIACGIFSALFVLALVAGRKIKFDPVLR
ncbi:MULTISPECIES: PA3371 family protein [unclassified Pseudomonas]|uniref:PA3371 family protein n=1 Tax=unclassified Pseudomonas TaxID=196821 RepID=UPI001CBF6BB6|nr:MULTISPECIES: PA3371 family protein [unclassified Pseudomonas]